MDHKESFARIESETESKTETKIAQDYKIDLHIHSTCSDGTKTPEELIGRTLQMSGQAKAMVAITDHDTVAGIPKFLSEAEKYTDKIFAIGGVEISCDYEGTEIHMLGYGVDPYDQTLTSALALYREERDLRNSRILARIREAGMEISEEDIKPIHEGDAIGRPAIARHLMEKGYVASVKEAFDLYLGEGRPCFVDRKKPSPAEAVELIKHSGGIAVLAHPVLYKKLTGQQLEDLLTEMEGQQMKGLESFYSRNKGEAGQIYAEMAYKHGFFVTCGSDYHGDVKPDIELFVGEGDLTISVEKIQPFLQALMECKPNPVERKQYQDRLKEFLGI